MGDEFKDVDSKAPLVPGQTYRITLKINSTYQKWHRSAITDLVKLYDAAERKIEVKTFEFLHPTNVTNPNFYWVRCTFLRTASDASPVDASQAAIVSPQVIVIAILGIVFSAIAVSGVLWKLEGLVKTTGGAVTEILNPWVVVGTVIVFWIFFIGRKT